jgi:hypothetical protein
MSAIWVPIFGIVFTFTAIVAIVVVSLRYRARKLEHEEVMKALEEGRDIPTLEIRDQRRKDSDLKMGVILLATGAGLYLFLRDGTHDMANMAGLGYIPAFLGIGLIALWFISKNGENKKD